MKFYLGTHVVNWLAFSHIPLFISRRRLFGRKSFPRAVSAYALDSGGFTELDKFGRWTIGPDQYIDEVRQYRDAIGQMDFAAPQDWMCEPWILKKTGLSMDEHLRRTVDNFIYLRKYAVDLPFVPVLQGWRLEDYERCAHMYRVNGVDLAKESTVGIGSVCRRQSTTEAEVIIRHFARQGIKLHGFGFKKSGIPRVFDALKSSDSMAWSFAARYADPLPECVGKHKNCANCWKFARRWHGELMTSLDNLPPRQQWLF